MVAWDWENMIVYSPFMLDITEMHILQSPSTILLIVVVSFHLYRFYLVRSLTKIWNGFVITTGVWLTNKKNKFYLEEISGYENLNLSFYNSAILMPFYFDKDVNEMNGQFTLELKPSWNAILCLFYICIETLCLDFLSVLYLFPISIL